MSGSINSKPAAAPAPKDKPRRGYVALQSHSGRVEFRNGNSLVLFATDEFIKRFAQLTLPERLIELLRWVCVLPAAVLADTAAQLVIDAAVQFASQGRPNFVGDSIIAYLFALLLYYVLPKSASIIAGAKTAPRFQGATAITLTVVAFLFSLMTHVISQHLAGRRIGITNCTHLFAETVGAVCGAACILFKVRRSRRPAPTA
jgi:hypothetical protein